MIIPKAIFNYYVHDTAIMETFQKNTNIFDFCGGVKIKGNWEFIENYLPLVIHDDYINYTHEQKVKYLLENNWEQSWSDDNWVKSDAINKESNNGISTDSAFYITVPKVAGELKDLVKEPIQNTLRYFISKNGTKIVKKNKSDNRMIQVIAGKYLQTLFINYENKKFEDYNLDFNFYVNKIQKEIENITPNINQLKLF